MLPSSKKMEQELRQIITQAGDRLGWRTALGKFIMNFPEGKIIKEIKGERDVISSLSPDAAQVAFFQARYPVVTVSSVKPGEDLVVASIDNAKRQSLGLIASHVSLLAWSPDGKKLVFFAEDASTDLQAKWPEEPFFERPEQPDKLFIFTIQDKNLERFDVLRPGSLALCSDQIWSPTGDELVYTILNNRKPPLDAEIRILSLITKQSRFLARGEFPTWSPTSDKIIFHGIDKNYYMINADGSNKTLLLEPNPKILYDILGPILWSPDGRWLLVPRGSYYSTVDLFVMDLETKIMVKIQSRTQGCDSWKGRR